jgi:hypothetical protein
LAALREAIDGLLDVTGEPLGHDDLHALVIGVERERDRLAIAAADVLVAWDDERVWRSDGSRRAADRLALDLHRRTHGVSAELGRARSLRHMPASRAAVLAGRLSLDDADALARARRDDPTVFADNEHDLVDTVAPLTHPDATNAIDYWRQQVLPELCEREADRRRARTHLSTSSTLDGMVAVTGTLDPVGGAIVTGELDRLMADIELRDSRDGTRRTITQRRAAAWIEMATRSASATPTTRARPLFTVLVGDDTTRHLCELATGTVITPGDVQHWAHLALVESVIFDGPSRLIATTTKRTFTGAIRRGIQVRDRRCTHPGCTVPADRCDIDHVVAYTRRPVTDQDGGRVRCSAHNRITLLAGHDRPPDITPRPDPTPLEHLRAKIRWRTITHWPLEPPTTNPGPPDPPDDTAPS